MDRRGLTFPIEMEDYEVRGWRVEEGWLLLLMMMMMMGVVDPEDQK